MLGWGGVELGSLDKIVCLQGSNTLLLGQVTRPRDRELGRERESERERGRERGRERELGVG